MGLRRSVLRLEERVELFAGNPREREFVDIPRQVDCFAGYRVARSDCGAHVLRTAVNRVKEEPIRAGVGDLRGSRAGHAHEICAGGRYLESTGRVGEEGRVRRAARGRGEDGARDRGNLELHRARRLHECVVFRPGGCWERELVHIPRAIYNLAPDF